MYSLDPGRFLGRFIPPAAEPGDDMLLLGCCKCCSEGVRGLTGPPSTPWWWTDPSPFSISWSPSTDSTENSKISKLWHHKLIQKSGPTFHLTDIFWTFLHMKLIENFSMKKAHENFGVVKPEFIKLTSV